MMTLAERVERLERWAHRHAEPFGQIKTLNLIDPKGGDTCRKDRYATEPSRAAAAAQASGTGSTTPPPAAKAPSSSGATIRSASDVADGGNSGSSAAGSTESDSPPPTTPDPVQAWQEARRILIDMQGRIDGINDRRWREPTPIREAGDALVAEVERLRENNRVLRCAFCGEAYPPGTPATQHERLTAHVAVCSKHPMRAAESRASDLARQLREERDHSDKAALYFANMKQKFHPTSAIGKWLTDHDTRRASPTPKGRNHE